MKKLLLAVSAILLTTGAFAQSGFEWGVKAGFNLANVYFDSDTRILGFHAGVFGEYVFNDRYGVQAELLYSRQGYNAHFYIPSTMKVELDYINLPILAKPYLFNDFSIDLGPQFGYGQREKRWLGL